jgi:hypothetical protein
MTQLTRVSKGRVALTDGIARISRGPKTIQDQQE